MLRNKFSATARSGGATFWGVLLILLTLGALLLMWFIRQHAPPPGSGGALPVLGQVPAFTLTNQCAETITLNNLAGHVWVADIIFTRCAGPCPRMTRQMSELQSLVVGQPSVRLISLTTDPVYDTPVILKQYGEKFGAQTNRWWFLTGAKSEIAKLALKGLQLAAVEKPAAERENPADLFIHSTLFVVVDRQGQLRAVVETDEAIPSEEGKPVTSTPNYWEKVSKPRLLAIIELLTKEK